MCGHTDGNFNHWVIFFFHKTNISWSITGWQTLYTRRLIPMVSFYIEETEFRTNYVWDYTELIVEARNQDQQTLYLFPGAAVTSYHNLGGLNNKYLFSYSSGGRKFEVEVSAGCTLSGVSRGESVPCFSASRGCQCSSACGRISPCFIFISSSLCVS